MGPSTPSDGHGVVNHGSSSAWAIVLTAASLDSTAAWAQRARHRPSHGRPSGVARPHRSDLRRAEALFHEGVAFADAQRWAEALDVFERSLALVPTASARFNVAVARLRLGRCLAATTAFEAHLASPEGDPNVARTARSRDLLAESRRCAATSAVGAAQAPGAASTETITRPTAPTLDAPAVRSALAAAAFARGRQALLARRNDEAADAFHEAVRIEPTAGTWRWLGVTLRGMARYTEAIAAFERYLAAPEADATAEQLAQAHVALAEMRRALGTLVVTVSPSRTTLLVDARPRSIGAGEVELDPGEHVVELRAEGVSNAPRRDQSPPWRAGRAQRPARSQRAVAQRPTARRRRSRGSRRRPVGGGRGRRRAPGERCGALRPTRSRPPGRERRVRRVHVDLRG